MEDHEGSCPMESVYCENKCGAKMLRKYLTRHSAGDCPKRPIKCPHCDKDFNFDILKVRVLLKIRCVTIPKMWKEFGK